MISNELIYSIIKTSPEPLTFAGVVALMHIKSNSRDSLHVFAEMERENIQAVLDELLADGRVEVARIDDFVYKPATE